MFLIEKDRRKLIKSQNIEEEHAFIEICILKSFLKKKKQKTFNNFHYYGACSSSILFFKHFLSCSL